MRKILVRLLIPIAVLFISLSNTPPAAADGVLVPCNQSTAFQQRRSQAPDTYYFNKPFEVYGSELACGEDGLPHLPIRLDRFIDVLIPFSIFLYTAGFIGWSGRSYLQAASKSSNPEEKEIFIDLPLAIQSFIKGLLWPVMFLQELVSGQLTAKDSEIPISPR
ncbi:MAG: Photosystem I reaction center subunit III [Leptolyngbyaceae cyanobacterium HOT.MB2.61]|jgi:photosystem I subunit 3|nr:Photosystem I reaction center subunit III [Leptolyngbyaceae cyanobacterium HOT.MB2.61]